MNIEIARIVVGEGRRPLNIEHAQRLAESIKETGLLQPIVVATPGFRLIAGLHRLEAFKILGRTVIPVNQRSMNKLEGDLAEIDENLMRHELTTLERMDALARRKEIYLAMHPEAGKAAAANAANAVRRGGPEHTTNIVVRSFAGEIAAKTGRSESAIYRDVKIANRLTEEAKAEIYGTPLADASMKLDTISQLAPAEQLSAVRAWKAAQGGPRAVAGVEEKHAETEEVSVDEMDPDVAIVFGAYKPKAEAFLASARALLASAQALRKAAPVANESSALSQLNHMVGKLKEVVQMAEQATPYAACPGCGGRRPFCVQKFRCGGWVNQGGV